MAWNFYIADPTDDTYATKLVDFMDFQVGGTGFNVADGTLDLGSPDPELTWIKQPPAAGGMLANYLYPETQIQMQLLAMNVSYDELLARVLELDAALQERGVIVWQPDTATEPRYIDYVPSPLSQLFHGQTYSMQKVVLQLLDTGIPLSITRLPFMRGPAQTVVNSVAVSNAVLDGHVTFTNPGNAPSPLKITIAPSNTSSKLVEARVARKSKGDLTDFATLYQFDPTEELTTLPKQWRRVWKEVVVPSTDSGLVGNYRVLCSVKLNTAALYRFQLRWGNVSTDPMGAANDVIELDNTDYSGWNDFADIPFGKVRFDESGSSLTLEMWAIGPDDDSPVANFATVTLLPADEMQADLAAPGFKTGKYGREDIWGTMWDLDGGNKTSVVTDDDSVRLYKTGGYCEYHFGVLPVGLHVAEFRGHLIRGAPEDESMGADTRLSSRKLGEMRIYENNALIETRQLRYLKGHAYTQWDRDNPKRCIWEADGSSTYRVRVQFTDNSGFGRRINVHKVVHWYMPYVDQGRQMVTDAYQREAYIADNSGARWLPLHNHGGLPRAAPGDNLFVFRFGVKAGQAALHDVDERGPRSFANPDLGANVTIEVVPYYTS